MGKVTTIDFDQGVINHAKKYNSAENVEYLLADIRDKFPKEKFDSIIWDAAIEHFIKEEIQKILSAIKSSLNSNGCLAGYTMVEREDGVKSLHQHEYEFKSKEDLLGVLTPHFRNAKVFETIAPKRHNL